MMFFVIQPGVGLEAVCHISTALSNLDIVTKNMLFAQSTYNIKMIRGSLVKIFFLLLYFYQSCLSLKPTIVFN